MKLGGVAFASAVLWAHAVADSGYRDPLIRFTALVAEVAFEMNLPSPMVLPTDQPLWGYERVAVGTLQRPGKYAWEEPTYVIFVRTFFLAEEGRLAWKVGISHELCHIELEHFTEEMALTDESETAAEQCAYDMNTDEAYFAWARANLRRHQFLSAFAGMDDDFLREVISEMIGIEMRSP